MSPGALTQGLAGHRPSLAPLKLLQHQTYLSCSAQLCSRALTAQAQLSAKAALQSTGQWLLMAQAQPGWAGEAEPDWLCWDSHRSCWELPPFCLQPLVVPAAQPSFQKEERVTKVCKCFSIYRVLFRNVIAFISRAEWSHFYQYLKYQFAACNKVHF